jgi:hypothetical protein
MAHGEAARRNSSKQQRQAYAGRSTQVRVKEKLAQGERGGKYNYTLFNLFCK